MRRFFVIEALAAMLAMGLFAMPAAADGPFTVSGIKVDASAASSTEARNAAIAAGRPAAWQMLFRRITRQQDWARMPQLSSDQLQRLISSYFPTKEKRSTTRYVAEVTYIFNPNAVTRLLQGSGIPFTVASAKRVLVIPMAPFYSRISGWTTALANPRFADTLVPFALPLGDGPDMQVLGALPFETASWADVAPVAARMHATEAVLIEAVASGRKMVVSLRRLGPDRLPVKETVELPLLQDAGGTYPSAADAAVHAMEDMWKSHAALDFSQKGSLTVELATHSLDQYAAAQKALASVPNVARVSILAMDIGLAQLTLEYQGSLDQLREALGRAGLTLDKFAGVWRLTPTAALGAAQ